MKPAPLRQQQRDFTRRRLVDTARELFMQKGSRATSVDDISKAAGTSRATFYAHFANKQDIIRELANNMLQMAFAVYEQFSLLSEWNHQSINAWMSTLFDAWEANAGATYVVIEEIHSELRRDSVVQMEHRVNALIGDNVLWERFSQSEARRRAALLLFQLERGMDAWHYGGWKNDREMLMATFTDIWVATLSTQLNTDAHDLSI